MNISLDDQLAAALEREASRTGRPLSALVAEAISQWLEKSRRSTWPPELTDFEPFTDLEPFESHRSGKRTGVRLR